MAMRRPLLLFLSGAADVAVAAISFYLALQATILLVQAPAVLLVPFTDLELSRLYRRAPLLILWVRGLEQSSTPLYAFGMGAFFPFAAVLLALSPRLARRAQGWARVFLVHLALAVGSALILLTLLHGSHASGALQRAMQALWPEAAKVLSVLVGAAAVALAGGAGYRALRPLVANAASARARLLELARWVLLPTLAAGAALLTADRRFAWTILLGALLVYELALGLPAALRAPRAPGTVLSADRPGRRGALALLAVFFLVLGALLSFDKAARAVTHARAQSDLTTARGRHWIVHVPAELVKVRPAEAWAAAADQRLEALATRLEIALPAQPLEAFFYASTEKKEEIAGDDEPFTVRPENRAIHWLVTPDGEIPDPRGEAQLLLRLAWGAPGSERIAEAVARAAAGTFHGHPLAAYAARITREEQPYPLREVLGLDGGGGGVGGATLSPLVADALGGAWVEHLRAQRGPGVLHTLWSEDLDDWPKVEKDWRSWLTSLPAPSAEPHRLPPALPFLRGISFSHEVRTEGYGSDVGAAQLARMRALGAGAVALVPYAFTQAPEQPSVRYRGTDESDARLSRTIAQARHLGLKTMLKPQLWAQGRFTGDIVFAKDADFDLWFADYRRWMLHHARLAALEKVDLLVIGTELGGVTKPGHPEAAWRSLIGELRRVYPGALTYAGNWAGDFETVPFWDALDLLGVNMYYPLAGPGEKPRADSPRLRDLRTRFAALSRRYGKHILFTEVGYAATTAAAVEPWKEDNAPPDPAMQARCYQVVLEAFYREPWLAGLFWWKWPSHGQGGVRDLSFNPLGKPAFQVLERWYGRGGR
jgi:hypothetical protein